MKAFLYKEFLELWRGKKVFFVPLILAGLAAAHPLTLKMIPQLTGISNLPPGSIIQIPPPKVTDTLAGTLSEVNQLGLFVLILALMGTVADEKRSGVAASVLSRSVSRGGYLLSKFMSGATLALLSLVAALGLSGYYTGVIIGPVAWGTVINAGLYLLPWFLVAVSITILFSTLLPSTVVAGGAALGTMLVLGILSNLSKEGVRYLPGGLVKEATQAIMAVGQASQPEYAPWPLVTALALLVGTLSVAWWSLERQEL